MEGGALASPLARARAPPRNGPAGSVGWFLNWALSQFSVVALVGEGHPLCDVCMGLTVKKGDCRGFLLLGPAVGLVAAYAWQLPGHPLCQDTGKRAHVSAMQPGAPPIVCKRNCSHALVSKANCLSWTRELTEAHLDALVNLVGL